MRIGLHAACCGLAAFVPLLVQARAAPPTSGFPGWPAQFDRRPLRELRLSEREERFASGFPGRIGRFTDGRREIVLRWAAQPTRRLHPAADCFRGSGYRVRPLPAVQDGDGLWGRFEAARGRERLLVKETIRDEQGHSWSDASAWYWAALLGRTRAPWWALTVAAEASGASLAPERP